MTDDQWRRVFMRRVNFGLVLLIFFAGYGWVGAEEKSYSTNKQVELMGTVKSNDARLAAAAGIDGAIDVRWDVTIYPDEALKATKVTDFKALLEANWSEKIPVIVKRGERSAPEKLQLQSCTQLFGVERHLYGIGETTAAIPLRSGALVFLGAWRKSDRKKMLSKGSLPSVDPRGCLPAEHSRRRRL